MTQPNDTNGPLSARPRVFDTLNWLLLVIGILLLMVGYLVLGAADERAENWAGTVAPLSLVAGYVLIFFSILIRPKNAPMDSVRKR